MFHRLESDLEHYTLHENQPDKKELELAAESLSGQFSELQIIAQRVGGDFGMEVRMGRPGGGSYFNPENISVTFDPLHVREDPDKARFVAGHEGAHRAITLHPMELGLTREKMEELYRQPFFGLTHNGPEDGAVNDWLQIGFHGLKGPLEKVYERITKDENPQLGTPEVFAMAAALGRWPKAALFVSEVLKDWYSLRSDPKYGPFGEIRQRALEAKEQGRPGDPAVKRWESMLAEPGRFSKKLDPDVEKVLGHTIEYCRESIATIPLKRMGPQGQTEIQTSRDPKALQTCGQTRFSTITEWVWPLVKELVEIDLKEESQRQMLGDQQRKRQDLRQKERDLQDAKQRGDSGAQRDLERDIRKLKKELEPYDSQSKSARSEIDKAVDQARRDQARELAKQVRDAEREVKEQEKRQRELEKERRELEKQAANAQGNDKQSLQKDLEQAQNAEAEAKAAAQAARDKLSDKLDQAGAGDGQPAPGEGQEPQPGQGEGNQPGQGTGEPGPDGDQPGEGSPGGESEPSDQGGRPGSGGSGQRNMDDLEQQIEDRLKRKQEQGEPPPVPFDSLSHSAKTALDRAFDQMPANKRAELRERARRELEKLEDKMNEELGGKLNAGKPLSHEERRRMEEAMRAQSEEMKRQADERKELDRKLQELRLSQMGDYDLAFDDVGDRCNQTYDRLRRVFLKEKYPKWEEGFDGGQRVNMELAMQSDADPAFLRKIWERRTIPIERDEAFEIWVDTSGSMGGTKCTETFRGAVFLAELFEKLGTKYEIHRFSDSIQFLKSFDETVKNSEVRDRIANLKSTGGGTNDAQAVSAGYARLAELNCPFKFLIVLTDAESGVQHELSRVVQKIKEERKVVLVHFGLGEGTSDRLGIYPYSFGNLKVKISDQERARGEKDFGDVLSEAVADMLLHPEKYLRYGGGK